MIMNEKEAWLAIAAAFDMPDECEDGMILTSQGLCLAIKTTYLPRELESRMLKKVKNKVNGFLGLRPFFTLANPAYLWPVDCFSRKKRADLARKFAAGKCYES